MKYIAFSLALLLAAVDAGKDTTASPMDVFIRPTKSPMEPAPTTADPTPPPTRRPTPPGATPEPTPFPTRRPTPPPTRRPTPPPTRRPTPPPTSKASKSKSAKSKSKKVGLFAKAGKVLSKQAGEAMDGLDYLLMTEAGGDDPSMSMGKDASSMSMMEFIGLRPTPSPADRGPIFGDSSVAMMSSSSDDSSSESD